MQPQSSIKSFDFNASSLQLEWKRFSTDFERILINYKIQNKCDKIKLNYLRLLMGQQSTQIINNLGLSSDDRKSFNEVMNALATYFIPTSNLYAARMNFYNRNQKVGESVKDFTAEIKKLAEPCDFGDFKNGAIRNRVLLGCKEKRESSDLYFSDYYSEY